MVGYGIYLMREKKKREEWIRELLKSKFFDSCFLHHEEKKNEVNLFCINCHECLCQHCVSSSTSNCVHNFIQIRRYVYQDVVKIHDMQKHLDCSKVQTYVSNASKVVFLNPRPPFKTQKSGPSCKVCERMLADQNEYCSIACKVSESLDNSSDNGKKFELYAVPTPDFSKAHADDQQNTEFDIKDNEDSPNKYCLSKSEILKPKKRAHKRKGFPRRAPLC